MGDTDDRLARVEARLAALERENLALRAELRASSASTPAPDTGATTPAEHDESAAPDAPGPVGRRRALKAGLGLAGAAAAGAVVTSATPAAAANGDPVKLGELNGASIPTGVQAGIFGFPSNALGESTSIGTAGSHIRMVPGGRGVPVQDTIQHARGDLVMDAFGTLWLCIVSGTPGTWRTLGGVGTTGPGAGSFYPLGTPTRAYDSRPGTTPAQGPKTPLPAGNVGRTISLRVDGFSTLDGVATVAVVNVLLVNAATGSGNFTIWANGAPKPQSNTLVWGGSAGRFSTLAYAAVDAQGRVRMDASLPTHVVIDVLGFFA